MPVLACRSSLPACDKLAVQKKHSGHVVYNGWAVDSAVEARPQLGVLSTRNLYSTRTWHEVRNVSICPRQRMADLSLNPEDNKPGTFTELVRINCTSATRSRSHLSYSQVEHNAVGLDTEAGTPFVPCTGRHESAVASSRVPINKKLDSSSVSTEERTDSEPERREAARPPWTLPILHNTLQLLFAGDNIHEWLMKKCERFEGRPFTVKFLGLPEMLVVSTPEAFEDILKHQFMNFLKGPHQKENLKDLLGDGIFAVDGVKWAHQRDVGTGLFRTQEFRECITEAVTRHTMALHDVLKQICVRNRSVDLYKLVSCFSTEVFTDISFGVTMNCLRANKELPFQAAFDRAQRLPAQRYIRPRWFWKMQKRMGLGAEDQLQLDIEEIDATVLSIVQQVLANRALTPEDGRAKNLSTLSLFLDTID